jgi:hypothetical protein
MQRLTRRLLALLLAALLTAMTAAPMAALAEDWRTQLRNFFGLEPIEETEATPTPAPTATPAPADQAEKKAVKQDWTLPITEPQRIVNYLHAFGKLPDNFITKQEAQELGWDSRWNYVGDVAPGKSIGGNRFGNYEKKLPTKPGRTWYECDTNYKGRKRGATRLLFSSDGLYYFTNDHYRTFTQMFPEE